MGVLQKKTYMSKKKMQAIDAEVMRFMEGKEGKETVSQWLGSIPSNDTYYIELRNYIESTPPTPIKVLQKPTNKRSMRQQRRRRNPKIKVNLPQGRTGYYTRSISEHGSATTISQPTTRSQRTTSTAQSLRSLQPSGDIMNFTMRRLNTTPNRKQGRRNRKHTNVGDTPAGMESFSPARSRATTLSADTVRLSLNSPGRPPHRPKHDILTHKEKPT